MLEIKFYPDSDLEDFSSDIKEYEEIWKLDGERIVDVWEKITGLKFLETYINAVIIDRISHSHPLSLRFNYATNQKKSVLVHELGHRILHRRFKTFEIKKDSLKNHKFLYLKLHSVFLEIYGDPFLKEAIDFDSKLSPDYKAAWEWALKFSKEERDILFKQILDGDLSKLQ